MLKKYVQEAEKERNVTFLGRLGTYRYLDMDVSIAEALGVAESFIRCIKNGSPVPPFFCKVL